ncbi:alpha/beta fold hydrolase [Natroniella sp. ANB-PHB2]|uniref:alpha/beta fold hydrolase n=1 Tax=Natroniella sp. ANB-PHB2 TaxID=3384444 RepID=UPI0038D50337
MPRVKINGVDINYKLDGSGKETILFLNGIMMSTASWEELVPRFTEQNDYQVLRVDFRDQGASSFYEEDYHIGIHVDDIKALLDYLELDKVHLAGISYGGMVAMLFALKYPKMLSSLSIANSVAQTSKYLQALSDGWEEAARLNSGKQFFKLAIPPIYSDDFHNREWKWLKERADGFDQLLTQEWFEGFIRLSKSSKEFDCLEELNQIELPTLLIASSRDIITPVYEMEKIERQIADTQMLIIKDAGHAAFYEKPEEFSLAILGFLALQN